MRFPIHIELRCSRFLFFLFLFLHVLAAGCVIFLPWPWEWRSFLFAMVGISAWRTGQPSKIRGVRLAAHGRIDCLLANGEFAPAAVLPDSTVFSQLVVLRLRIGDARQIINLVLVPGCMAAGQFRVLRLWLRWARELREISPGASVGKSA